LNGVDLLPIEKPAHAREVIESVDVRPGVPAHGNHIRSGASAVRKPNFPVEFREAVQEWRMIREVRHANEIRLAQVVGVRSHR
jgi:hypothetical protein